MEDRAQELLADLEKRSKLEYIPPTILYLIYRTFGELESASGWLDKAYEEHDSFLGWLRVSPIDSYRIPPDPRLTEKLI